MSFLKHLIRFCRKEPSCWSGGLYKPTINYFLALKFFSTAMHLISSGSFRFAFLQVMVSFT